MDPGEALADLKQISSQIERAVVARRDGVLEGCTVADQATAERLAQAAVDLYAAAERAGTDLDRPPLVQVEVATPDGSVFAVRDAERLVCAVTRPDPTVGLIFYDLKTCLRNIAEDPGADLAAPVTEASDEA